MPVPSDVYRPEIFSEILYEKMKLINVGVEELELYEFRYGLDNMVPKRGGWASIVLDKKETIEQRISDPGFFHHIQLRPRLDDRIVLDENILRLAHMLFVGLVTGEYSIEWVNAYFYFDIRGFYFLPRTVYFTPEVLARLGGKPLKRFEPGQKRFERKQDIGYKEFKQANAEVDACFIEIVQDLIAARGTPILITIAGPTAAGKTEIVERLRLVLVQAGMQVTSVEMDNFIIDQDYREAKGIHSMGKEAFHFELFMHSLEDLLQGKQVTIPRYKFGISSHALDGKVKAGFTPLQIEPADIIFIEGNFPFQIPEVSGLIGVKVVYLTDDPVRLKRKWKRDIDYRKKYETTYFRNRFFMTQFMRANDCYRLQMAACDLVVDTTGAAIWATPEIAQILSMG
jgi:uridine kinase